jgi:site-specific DNA-methyltransferase (cytosine-N4-specific)
MRKIVIGRADDKSMYNCKPFSGKIIVGDAKTALKSFPAETFRCCITSPPYWSLRDYGIPNQIGAEANLEEYIENLKAVFTEVRRVLTSDGTLWLNIGDSYTSGNRTWRDADKKNRARGMHYRPPTPNGLKPKDLIGVPWRVAFALQSEGWYLRSDIIWYKTNCQPESVKDRPTRAHEYLFLLSKSEKYYYDYKALLEPTSDNGGTRNRRSVWLLNTFPRRLVEPCIYAGSQAGDIVLDPFMGSGTLAEVCIEAERKFVGIEINAEYAGMAVKRAERGERNGATK